MKSMTILEIKNKLEQIHSIHDPIFKKLSTDSRKGVQKLLTQWHDKKQKELAEQKRIERMMIYERKFNQMGYQLIAGIDEVGRGPLAGPVVAAAVILKKDSNIRNINDSKKLTANQREEIYEEIVKHSVSIGVGIIEAEEIDQLNIFQATKKAMLLSVQNLHIEPEFLLVDAMDLHTPYPSEAIIKGDAASISIAAASIVAKVRRDQLMKNYHQKYPQYGFNRHNGYGTKEHLQALSTYGPCLIHRKSFEPLKSMI